MSSYDCPNPSTCHSGGRCDYGCSMSGRNGCPNPRWCAHGGNCNMATNVQPQSNGPKPLNPEGWASWKEALPGLFGSSSSDSNQPAGEVSTPPQTFTPLGGRVRSGGSRQTQTPPQTFTRGRGGWRSGGSRQTQTPPQTFTKRRVFRDRLRN